MSVRIASILLAIPLSGCLCMGGGKSTSELSDTPRRNKEIKTGNLNPDNQKRATDNQDHPQNRTRVTVIKKVAAPTPCAIAVVAKTPGAVGDPCLTTMKFMKRQGLSDAEIAQVEKIATELKERGDEPLAH